MSIESRQSSYSDSDEESSYSEEVIELEIPALWTVDNIENFKDEIRKSAKEGIIKVGSGEVVTIRVPTHEDGKCIYWEFATDTYDIAFGVDFEFNKCPESEVTVQLAEESEEEEYDYWDDDEEFAEINDIEAPQIKQAEENPVGHLLPTYRRNSNEVVYAGSHVYPSRGVYLLKFDNSYSLLRSKMLYYRVYYTK